MEKEKIRFSWGRDQRILSLLMHTLRGILKFTVSISCKAIFLSTEDFRHNSCKFSFRSETANFCVIAQNEIIKNENENTPA